jgi:UDP-N-acetylmuramoyl-L-alanine---L-glutamate ligase
MVLVDDEPPGSCIDERPVLPLSGPGLAELLRCDAVVKAPGVSRRRAEVARLREAGVAVVGGLGLWMQEANLKRVACVTGTKGKSTTVAICGHLLQRWGVDVFVGGNLGQPPYDPDAGTHDLYVVETSSFQATDLASSPDVVAVTSLAPDHLDWHGDVETYYTDKLSACRQPGARVTVANGANTELRARAAMLGPERRWVKPRDPALDGGWVDELGLPGPHHRQNALVARALLEELGVAQAHDPDALAIAATGFRGLESRLEQAGTVAGVSFVDDSLSTNVLSAVAALEALPGRRLAIILGGHDRGIDYAPLARALADREWETLAVTLPESGRRIGEEVLRELRHGRRPSHVEVLAQPSMRQAVQTAFGWARPAGAVLLSPAAPSFGQFRDYRDRSAAFRAAIELCAASATA